MRNVAAVVGVVAVAVVQSAALSGVASAGDGGYPAQKYCRQSSHPPSARLLLSRTGGTADASPGQFIKVIARETHGYREGRIWVTNLPGANDVCRAAHWLTSSGTRVAIFKTLRTTKADFEAQPIKGPNRYSETGVLNVS